LLEGNVVVIKPLFNFTWDMLYFITGEGRWRLRPHEKIVLEAVIDNLNTSAQGILRSLLRQKMFIQKSNSRIVRPRFYTAYYSRLHMPIDYLDKQNKVYEVVLDVAGHRQRAHVEFFRGEIDSVQFPNDGDFYFGKIVSVVHVSETDPRLTNAAEIDKDEHGG
jgi:hypothetical protein